MSKFEAFIDSIKDGSKTLSKKELKDLVNSAKSDKSDFVRQQAQNLEHWTVLFNEGQLTRKGYVRLVFKMAVLGDLEALNLNSSAKASAQRLAEGIKKLVINSLFSIIK